MDTKQLSYYPSPQSHLLFMKFIPAKVKSGNLQVKMLLFSNNQGNSPREESSRASYDFDTKLINIIITTNTKSIVNYQTYKYMYELMTRLRHPIVSAHPQTPQINQIKLNIKHNCKTRHRHPIVSAVPQTSQLNQIKSNCKHKCKTRHRHPTVSAHPQKPQLN